MSFAIGLLIFAHHVPARETFVRGVSKHGNFQYVKNDGNGTGSNAMDMKKIISYAGSVNFLFHEKLGHIHPVNKKRKSCEIVRQVGKCHPNTSQTHGTAKTFN